MTLVRWFRWGRLITVDDAFKHVELESVDISHRSHTLRFTFPVEYPVAPPSVDVDIPGGITIKVVLCCEIAMPIVSCLLLFLLVLGASISDDVLNQFIVEGRKGDNARHSCCTGK